MNEEPSGGLRNEDDQDAQQERDNAQHRKRDLIAELVHMGFGIVVHDGAQDLSKVDPNPEEGDEKPSEVSRAGFGRIDVGESDKITVRDAEEKPASVQGG